MTLCLHEEVLNKLIGEFDKPLIQNNLRGIYVELMIAGLLGDGWKHNGSDWGAYDLEHSSGTKVEIKQSAARQTWSAPSVVPRSPTFSIRTPKMEWIGSVATPRTTRIADIYVFAWHSNETVSADHRDESQWEFFVVPVGSLPAQRTISLNPIKLLANPVGAGRLKYSVEAMIGQGVEL